MRVQVLVHKYNEEEWTNVIAKDPAWSKEETDYLLDLCNQFSLRFMVIADRYEVQIWPAAEWPSVHTQSRSVIRQPATLGSEPKRSSTVRLASVIPHAGLLNALLFV